MNSLSAFLILSSWWYVAALYYRERGERASLRKGIVLALVGFGAWVVGSTEALEAGAALHEWELRITYALVAALSVGWAVYRYWKQGSGPEWNPLGWERWSRSEKFLLLSTIILLVLTLLTALIYPPNNNDSMAYHMARVGYWVQNGSIGPYATPIEPQLHHPPLAEWIILHLYLLWGSDFLANLVQWAAGLGSLVVLSLLVEEVGGSRWMQLATAFVGATIPMVILQMSSTQNDVVVAFFCITLALYLLRLYRHRRNADLALAALAFGLAILTKAPGYLYAIVLLLVWGGAELVRLKSQRWFIGLVRLAGQSAALLAVGLLLNVGHYSRNMRVYGHPLNDSEGMTYYTNQIHTPVALASTLSRNLGVHFGVPGLHLLSQYGLEKLHIWMGLDIRDPRTTLNGSGFDLPILSNNEDNASNFLHLLWLLGCFAWLLRIRVPAVRPYQLLALVVAVQFVVFCGYLKWQPWNSRLHTTLFLLASPVAAYGLNSAPQRLRWITLWLLLMSGLCFALTNFSRPLITIPPLTRPNSIWQDRMTKYYINNSKDQPAETAIGRYLNRVPGDSLNVGILLAGYEGEYLWFRQLKPTTKLYHLRVWTTSRVLDTHPEVDYIISTQASHDTILYKNRVFHRLDLTRKRSFLYAPIPGRGGKTSSLATNSKH